MAGAEKIMASLS